MHRESANRLRKALDHMRPRDNRAYARQPATIDVTSVRIRMGMTQEQFAARFGFPVATLRHWERGDRNPRGPARVLLAIIDCEPRAVLRALARFSAP